jgi:pyridoxine 4-dehydrogenase
MTASRHVGSVTQGDAGTTTAPTPGGSLTLADGLTINRLGYGAMQLAGPNVFGPPLDLEEALDVLRVAVELGITYIDTADFYGPAVTNELIWEALYPYPPELHVFTKVGGLRGTDGAWLQATSPASLRTQVESNLRHLRMDTLDLVYLRVGSHDAPEDFSIADEFAALAELREQGRIRHLGLSGVTDSQLTEAQSIAPVVAVQNLYNLVHRHDDPLVDRTAREGIAFVSFFPLGGIAPLQSEALSEVARSLNATSHQVALAWLLQRSPNSVVIPGTSSVAHLRQNVAAADLVLPDDAISVLDRIGTLRTPG